MRLFNKGGWLFLALTLCGIAILAIFDRELAQGALQLAWHHIVRLSPLFLAILVILAISEALLDERRISQFVGRASGIRGWVITLIGGTLSVGPFPAWIPALQDLQRKGMRDGLIATFLFIRSFQLPFLPLIVHYFGWTFAIVFAAQAIVFAIASGWLIERILVLADGRPMARNEVDAG